MSLVACSWFVVAGDWLLVTDRGGGGGGVCVLVSSAVPVLQLPGRRGEEGAASVQPAEEAGEPGPWRGAPLPRHHDGRHLPEGTPLSPRWVQTLHGSGRGGGSRHMRGA